MGGRGNSGISLAWAQPELEKDITQKSTALVGFKEVTSLQAHHNTRRGGLQNDGTETRSHREHHTA